MGRRNRRQKGLPIIMRGGKPVMMGRPRMPKDMSDKEIQTKIYALEYRRAELQKNKRHNMRVVQAIERVTEQIKLLRIELEIREKKNV